MSSPSSRPTAVTCVWMSGGVLAYKLCDRDFDCDHCSLDAALRGTSPPRIADGDRPARNNSAVEFPDDRLYSSGHVWVQRVSHTRFQDTGLDDSTLVRVGLDAFAGALLSSARRVVFESPGKHLKRGERFCEIELDSGTLPLRLPLSGVLEGTNSSLTDSVRPLVATPYGDGWLIELRAELREEFDALVPCDGARDRARHDLRRFGRLAALDVLKTGSEVGATLPDGGEPLTDLHSILGDARYLSLLRDVIHN